MDAHDDTIKAYDTYPQQYATTFESHFSRIIPTADQFISRLRGKRVLDLGSGPGHYAAYFQSKGLEVVCADLSARMLELCRQKQLQAVQMDLEHMAFQPHSFNGIWAYASLLHIPKARVSAVLNAVGRTAKTAGTVFIAVKQGDGEGYEMDEKFPSVKRWFSYFQAQELEHLLRPRFEIISVFTRESKNTTWLNYLLRT